ncbi:HTH DNA binding domain-containing protein [Mesorhizobium sp. YR577]|nr:RHE_PE00001 family protein [Mesorhizobium sp. YR577]SFU20255.1 HTH DNA binding domain-containing protein [Mesorhizobium sp. YR577]
MVSMAYDFTPLSLEKLLVPVSRAGEALTRLDERLARSPVCEGWIGRMHFHDAVAALWVQGELVHIEDLVLHDARMDIRAPTHELTRAHSMLRTRRKILANKADWALSRDGMRQLAGSGAIVEEPDDAAVRGGQGTVGQEAFDGFDDDESTGPLAGEFATIDAVLERSRAVLDGLETKTRESPSASERDSLVYDRDWNEGERLSEWNTVAAQTEGLPAVLRAAILSDAWSEIEVLQHASWLGPLFVAALLRQTAITTNHLACLNVGLRNIPIERRRSRDRATRLLAFLDAIHQSALAGLKEHDRLMLAREQMERRLKNRRSSSNLPRLIELVLARPLVSTTMIQSELKLTRQGVLNLVGELNLREITGRKRFQAWGVV